MIEFHQLAAALYLAAGIGALVGLVLPSPRMNRGARWGLVLGAVVQAFAFATLHRVEAPSITSLPVVLASSAWMTVVFAMLLTTRVRLPGLAAVVGPMAFVSVFVASLGWNAGGELSLIEAGPWPHVHVLLASGGLALLGIAGLAGLFFLLEHRRLKAKPPVASRVRLPSLEALDRVNVVTTTVGFTMLSLGIVTGMAWLKQTQGSAWMGTSHEAWMVISWAIYLGLVCARFAGRQGARQAAASALAGFAFLLFGIVGVGVMG
ncbi:MAG: ABC-type uncharacterized transport system permease subunit [Myxococcota bacterium]